MFEIGDLIIYGSTGVCKVVDIKKIGDTKGVDNNKLYYVLEPVFQNGTIFIPVNNTKVFMRHIITKEEAENLIDTIPNIEAEIYNNRSPQQLASHYEDAIQTHDCADLIELTMSIYAKKLDLQQNNKKFGQVDERFMKRAEDLLYGELSVALDIPKSEVPQYISSRISAEDDTLKWHKPL